MFNVKYSDAAVNVTETIITSKPCNKTICFFLKNSVKFWLLCVLSWGLTRTCLWREYTEGYTVMEVKVWLVTSYYLVVSSHLLCVHRSETLGSGRRRACPHLARPQNNRLPRDTPLFSVMALVYHAERRGSGRGM